MTNGMKAIMACGAGAVLMICILMMADFAASKRHVNKNILSGCTKTALVLDMPGGPVAIYDCSQPTEEG